MLRGLGGLAALLLLASSAAAEPFRFLEGSHGKGELWYHNGVPVLCVAGTPEEIGEQVGALALGPAQRILGYPRELLQHIHLGLLWWPLVKAGDHMVERFPADYRAELEAAVRSAQVPREPVVAGNTLFDIKKILA